MKKRISADDAMKLIGVAADNLPPQQVSAPMKAAYEAIITVIERMSYTTEIEDAMKKFRVAYGLPPRADSKSKQKSNPMEDLDADPNK